MAKKKKPLVNTGEFSYSERACEGCGATQGGWVIKPENVLKKGKQYIVCGACELKQELHPGDILNAPLNFGKLEEDDEDILGK